MGDCMGPIFRKKQGKKKMISTDSAMGLRFKTESHGGQRDSSLMSILLYNPTRVYKLPDQLRLSFIVNAGSILVFAISINVDTSAQVLQCIVLVIVTATGTTHCPSTANTNTVQYTVH